MKVGILSYYDVSQRDNGGSVRTYYLAKGLLTHSDQVCIIIPDRHVTSESVDGIKVRRIKGILPYSLLRLFSNILGIADARSLYLYDPSFLLRSFNAISQCDIIQVDTPVPAGAIISFMLAKIFRKSIVVDSHDAFQSLRLEHLKTLRKMLEVWLERISYRCAKLILTVSEVDKRLITGYGIKPDNVVVIPNGVDTGTFKPEVDALRTKNQYNLEEFQVIGFVGNMEYPPNQEAVQLISSNLVSNISNKIPGVRFLVVGRKPRQLPDNPYMIFTGIVENLVQILGTFDVAIAPLLHGSGTRLKILEYFACGLPVVSTTIGTQGLETDSGINILIEDDMSVFSASVVRLLHDKALSIRIGRMARQLVVEKYDWKTITDKLCTVYGNLLSK